MFCLLVSERLCSFFLEGTVMVSPSPQPHLSPSGCFFPLPHPLYLCLYVCESVCLCVCLPPSATLPELTFAVSSALLFCFSDFWLRFSHSFCFPASLVPFVVSPTSSSHSSQQTPPSSNLSFTTCSLIFVLPVLCLIRHNLIYYMSHYPIFHYFSLIFHHFRLVFFFFFKGQYLFSLLLSPINFLQQPLPRTSWL